MVRSPKPHCLPSRCLLSTKARMVAAAVQAENRTACSPYPECDSRRKLAALDVYSDCYRRRLRRHSGFGAKTRCPLAQICGHDKLQPGQPQHGAAVLGHRHLRLLYGRNQIICWSTCPYVDHLSIQWSLGGASGADVERRGVRNAVPLYNVHHDTHMTPATIHHLKHVPAPAGCALQVRRRAVIATVTPTPQTGIT